MPSHGDLGWALKYDNSCWVSFFLLSLMVLFIAEAHSLWWYRRCRRGHEEQVGVQRESEGARYLRTGERRMGTSDHL